MSDNNLTGSRFDDFLEEEGIYEEVTARAHKRLFALQVADAMKAKQITKQTLATTLSTSRSQVARILDPNNTSTSVASLEKVAKAVGGELKISLAI